MTKLKLKKIYNDTPCIGCYFMVNITGEDVCAQPHPFYRSDDDSIIGCEVFDTEDCTSIWVVDVG